MERIGSLVRFVGPADSVIVYARPSSSETAQLIRDQVAALSGAGRSIEWKIYSHDGLEELSRLLAEHGFQAKPHETLLALDLRSIRPPRAPPPGLEIRRAESSAAVTDYAQVDHEVFPQGDPDRATRWAEKSALLEGGLYVAYLDRRPVGVGRVEIEPDRPFASLFGGGTLREFRGRGIYLELVRARAEFAREQGGQYLLVEAVDTTSRPILEKLGFTALAGVEAWTLGPGSAPGRSDQGPPADRADPAPSRAGPSASDASPP